MATHLLRYVVFTAVAFLLSSCAVLPDGADRRHIVKKLYKSTLQIFVSQPDGVRRAGSGVVVKADTETGEVIIVTAGHVLTDREDLKIFVVGKFGKTSYPATVIGYSEEDDLAVLLSKGPKVTAAAIGADAELGEEVWVVSYPWGRRRTLVTGIVSQIDWPEPKSGVTRTDVPLAGPIRLIDATVGYGTSGGGVFKSENGRLLGIVRGYRTVNIPIPGTEHKPVRLPIAGETTVVPAGKIRAFLAASGVTGLAAPAE